MRVGVPPRGTSPWGRRAGRPRPGRPACTRRGPRPRCRARRSCRADPWAHARTIGRAVRHHERVGQNARMADDSAGPEVHHGLEGVVAFETQIAEPDKEGSALRYRGVDIEDIVGRVPFENVWGLLIDGAYTPGLAPAEPYNLPVHTGDVRVDVQAAVAMLAPAFGFGQTYDISDEQARQDIGRLAVMVLSYAAQSARGLNAGGRAAAGRRPGRDPRREVPDPLEGRGRPQARQGDRRLLVLRGRARDERLDLHRPGHHLDRRRRRRGVLRRDRRDERPAARRCPGPRADDDRGRRGVAATPRGTSRACSTPASG